jgi:hypothetical protein
MTAFDPARMAHSLGYTGTVGAKRRSGGLHLQSVRLRIASMPARRGAGASRHEAGHGVGQLG